MLGIFLLLPKLGFSQFFPTLNNNDKRSKLDTAAVYSTLNLNWATATNWETYDSVNAVWLPYYTTGTNSPNSATKHTLLRGAHGDTIVINASATITLNYLFIDSGALILSKGLTQAASSGLRLGGTATLSNVNDSVVVTNNGRFGFSDNNFMHFDINKDTAIYKFTGKNIFNLTRIKYSATTLHRCRVYIDNNMSLDYNGLAFTNFPNSATINSYVDSITYFINANKTVKLADTSAWHMTSKTTSVKGGNYIYNINGTLDLGRTNRLSVLAPTDTAVSNVIVNVAGTLKLGRNQVIGDTLNSATKGKVLLHVLPGGTVTAYADSSLAIYNNIVFNMMDSTASYRKIVAAIDTLFPIAAASDTTNNSVVINNSGAVDTFTVKVYSGIAAAIPAASLPFMVNRQWKISKSASGPGNIKVQLKWMTVGQNASFNPANPISIYVYTGARWKEDTATISGAGTRTSPYVATVSGVDSFQILLIGNRNLAMANPTIASTGTLVPFVQGLGAPSAAQSFTVSGTYLTGAMTVTAPANYQVSLSPTTGFASSVSITPVAGNVASTTVYVRLNAAALGSYSGNVTVSTAGAASILIPVTGNTNQPAITQTGTLATFTQTLGAPSAVQTFTISGTNLAQYVLITPPYGYQISVNGGPWIPTIPNQTPATPDTVLQTGTSVTNITVSVRLNASTVGVYSGNITLTSLNSNIIYVPVFGTTVSPVVNPAIVTTGTLVSFLQHVGTPSDSQAVVIGGTNLVGRIVVSVPSYFQVSADSGAHWLPVPPGSAYVNDTIQNSNATVNNRILIRLNASAPGFYTGIVTITSPGSNTISIPVSGTTVGPVVTSSVTSLLSFAQNLPGPSASQFFVFNGTNLTGNVTVTPPPGYEISFDHGTTWVSVATTITQTAGAVANDTVLVRLNASGPGTYSGNISITSAGATPMYVAVTGSTVSTGIGGVNKDIFSVYPNPATTQLTIRHLPAKAGTVIEVLQVDGRRVLSIAPELNAKETTLNISDLAAASYFVIITNGTERYSLQIRKN